MATNDLKKTVTIDVDSKKFSKFLKEFQESMKTVIGMNQKILELFNRQDEVEKKRVRTSREYANTINDRIEKLRKEVALQKELRDLEKPRNPVLEGFTKAKNISKGGLGWIFTNKRDQTLADTASRVEDYDQQIKELEIKRSKYKNPKGKHATELTNQIEDLQKKQASAKGEGASQANRYAAMAIAAQKVSDACNKMASSILNLITTPFKQLAEGVMGAITAMTQLRNGVATFNTSNSLITNATAREQQLKYGLNASQNYGFTQAKSMLNIQTDEDLMYMNSEQRERLLAYMDKYSEWYSDLESSGVLQNIQELQLSFEELKQEIAMDFLSWVAENKEAIMAIMQGTFEFIKWIANGVINIFNFLSTMFGNGGKQYDLYDSASDQINNSTVNAPTTNINMNINNTNNATGVLGSQEALDQFQEENWSKLAKQVVAAIGG